MLSKEQLKILDGWKAGEIRRFGNITKEDLLMRNNLAQLTACPKHKPYLLCLSDYSEPTLSWIRTNKRGEKAAALLTPQQRKILAKLRGEYEPIQIHSNNGYMQLPIEEADKVCHKCGDPLTEYGTSRHCGPCAKEL